jgi:hypothetical protein
MNNITDENRAEVVARYVEEVVEGMSAEQLAAIVSENIAEHLEKFSNRRLEEEITFLYPDFFGEETK